MIQKSSSADIVNHFFPLGCCCEAVHLYDTTKNCGACQLKEILDQLRKENQESCQHPGTCEEWENLQGKIRGLEEENANLRAEILRLKEK